MCVNMKNNTCKYKISIHTTKKQQTNMHLDHPFELPHIGDDIGCH